MLENRPANHHDWQWNSIRPRESEHKDTVWAVFQDLMSFLPWLDRLQDNKDVYTVEELNETYIAYLKNFIAYRFDILEVILADHELYLEVEDFAAKNYMFDLLIDGYTTDSNRNMDVGGEQLLPLMPYSNQLEFIHELEYGKKSVHVEKSRRAGASTYVSFQQRRNLRHKKNMVMLASNKSSKDIDLKGDTKNNSTFTRIDFHFNNSIFVPDDWENDALHNTSERKLNQTAIYRGHNPILFIYGTNRLDGSVFGKGTGTGQASHEFYGDEIDPWSAEHENIEGELFSAVSASTGRMILFSTYRSIAYSFFKVKKTHNTKVWTFIRLHWKDNPTCNQSWYDRETGKLNDPVKVAREYDINPAASIKGRVWPNLDEKKHFITKQEAINRFGEMTKENGWDTIIASDNGGHRMSQNYSLIKIHKATSLIFIEDTFFIDNTSRPEDTKKWALKHGFDMYSDWIHADRAITQNHTYVNHSTAYLLAEQGFNVNEVDNRDIMTVHRDIFDRIELGQLYCNKDCEVLCDMMQIYRYKDDGLVNKQDSHVGDAVSYGIKGYFLSGTKLAMHKV